MQSGERVDFEEVHHAVGIGSNIDPSAVAAAQSAPGGKREGLSRIGHAAAHEVVTHPLLALLFVDV